MRTYRGRRIPVWVQLAQVSLACSALALAAGLAALDEPWTRESAVKEGGAPIADQVERAVAQAEAEANSARASISVSAEPSLRRTSQPDRVEPCSIPQWFKFCRALLVQELD